MPDISTGQIFTNGQSGISHILLNQIISLSAINSSFISNKNPITNLQANDNFVIARNDGTWARITGSALADGLVIAEPNYARMAVGPLQSTVSTINGDMQVWQRNTSFAALGAAGHTKISDKFAFDAIGAMTGRCTVAQQAVNFPGTANYPFTEFATRVTITTAQASLAAGDGASISQYVERQLARALFTNPHSLQVVLQCSITGTFCVFIKNNNGGTPNQTYVAECVVTAANTPQRFTFQAISALPTGTGTWGTIDTDYAYIVGVCLGSGSTGQTTAGAWQSGNFLGDANQTNLFATNGATLDITLIQHESGSVCTPFLWVSFDMSLFRCQRYYCKTYPYESFAGAITSPFMAFTCTSTGGAITFWQFPNQMRGSLTINVYDQNNGAGPASTVYDSVSGTHIGSSASATNTGKNGVGAISFTSGGTVGHVLLAQLTSDADF